MAYNGKINWQLNDTVTPEDLNRIEQGIKDNDTNKLGKTETATSATKLSNKRTINVTGAATGTATGFDGSENINIPVTSVDPDKLSKATPVNKGGTGSTTPAGARANLEITPTNIGAAPTSHNHNASDINAGTLGVDRLPVVPVNKGGTGATTQADARANLGITPANIGAAPASHNHDASNINVGTLSADRLPLVPVNKGGTGVTDLNVTKLKRDTSSDSLTQIYLSPTGNDSNTGITSNVPMKTIRAAVGRYGGLNRLQLHLAPGTYTDTTIVVISGSQHVTISGTSTTPGAVVVSHPIIFQSCDAYLYRVTFDLSASTLTDPGVTFRQSKYNIQECVFKGKAGVHAGINASLGSSGYVVGCTFQTGKSGTEIGSGASMTALNCTLASVLEIGFNVNGGLLLSGSNTNSAGTQFTMYNSATIINDGMILNPQASAAAIAEAAVIE